MNAPKNTYFFNSLNSLHYTYSYLEGHLFSLLEWVGS